MKLTIVIPAYNVEKYIGRCLSSCVSQDISLTDYEIIVVNDGSNDNSLIIAEEFADNYTNIRVITQSNKGLSSARNTGFNDAIGEYVWFVDSDDWIVNNCLSDILVQCNGIDVLCLSYLRYYENGAKEEYIAPSVPKTLTGKSLFNTRRFCTPAQFYIYKRDFLINNNIYFYEGIYHEDMEFTPRMLCEAVTINIYLKPVYYYNIRSSSIMTTVNPQKSYDLLKVAKNLSKYSEGIHEIDVKHTFDYYISISLNNALNMTCQYTKEVNYEFSKVFAQNRTLFKHLRHSPLLKNRVEGLLFSMFPHNCITVYKMLKIINLR